MTRPPDAPLTAERKAVEKWLRQWGIHNDGEILGLLDAMEKAAEATQEAMLAAVQEAHRDATLTLDRDRAARAGEGLREAAQGLLDAVTDYAQAGDIDLTREAGNE